MSIYLIIFILFIVLFHIGLYGIFEKYGEKGYKALIPVWNWYIWVKIVQKPLWWFLTMLIPFIGTITFLMLQIELANVLGKRKFVDHVLAVFFWPFYAIYMGFGDTSYVGQIDKNKYIKSPAREWADAILFAVVAATIIRSFLIEAFTIPTSSMEKSLLIGDFLFVSKINYGPKIPETPLAIPFMHHSIPGTSIPSYTDILKLPFYRLPGLEEIERNDVVVFNYPEGDTVDVVMQSNQSYPAIIRSLAEEFRKRDYVAKKTT